MHKKLYSRYTLVLVGVGAEVGGVANNPDGPDELFATFSV